MWDNAGKNILKWIVVHHHFCCYFLTGKIKIFLKIWGGQMITQRGCRKWNRRRGERGYTPSYSWTFPTLKRIPGEGWGHPSAMVCPGPPSSPPPTPEARHPPEPMVKNQNTETDTNSDCCAFLIQRRGTFVGGSERIRCVALMSRIQWGFCVSNQLFKQIGFTFKKEKLELQ